MNERSQRLMAEVQELLRARTLRELRTWYDNPEGRYEGAITAELGSTTYVFNTGGGWAEPQLTWNSSPKRWHRITWVGDVIDFTDEQLVDEQAITKLKALLTDLDWRPLKH